MIYIKETEKPVGISKADYAKQQSRIAHGMLKSFALKLYGMDLTDEMLGRGEHGKPYIKGSSAVHFNISHCDGAAVVAFGSKPLGVDIERMRSIKPSLAEYVCTGDELEFLSRSNDFTADFLRLWTLKESYVKAIGEGLSYPLKSVSFSIKGDRIECNKKEFIFSQYNFKNFVLSLCYYADDETAKAGCTFV